ncbi:MAG: type II toxin-antitoxin system RelE/ParE family toxin [Methanobacteriota archaeon]|nr:MAG: type II toxin-antitoxin system RelE/ParE family toxin [Euryarchaeota archaeon]
MSYKVRIHPKAIKELGWFPDEIQEKIKKKIRALSKEFMKPKSRLDVKKVKGSRKEIQLYRLRVGDYRIVFEFADDVIWIARISHRRDSYRGL